MFSKRTLSLLAAVACLVGLMSPVLAAEVDSDSVYCFSTEDFSQQKEPLVGVCILQLPDSELGTVMLGTRVVQQGDIFTADQLSQMTFCPVRNQEDTLATVGYLPIYEDRVEDTAMMTISIRGKRDQAPTVKDLSLETYKNIPNNGQLKATDPEGQPLAYTVTRQPRRGTVVVRDDGTFTYTPQKNKVGVDSFTYKVTDPAGNVSGEATVTVQILKPSDHEGYQDTVGLDCRFEAEWLRNTGLFAGEQVGGMDCFQPEKAVTRGQFLAMLMDTLEVEQSEAGALMADAPRWLRPYLAAAERSGLLADLESGGFDQPLTGGEAAVMVQKLLALPVQTGVEDPVQQAVTALNENGYAIAGEAVFTRADAADILYCLSRTPDTLPQ